jgi:drug/metabolite transporter (DMT)-like permease
LGPLLIALLSALLFGASTPASKVLLGSVPPLQLAGLLYLGAALGTLPVALRDRKRRAAPAHGLDRANRRRLWGSVLLGGTVGPVLLLLGLQRAGSASVALLLNLEMAATALLGVLVFREHLSRVGWAGVVVGLAAGVVIAVPGGLPGLAASALVAGACLAWGLDNHLTALLDGLSPAEATVYKGAVAGAVNLALGLTLEPFALTGGGVAWALLVGVFAYGVSIVLYITSAHHLGATRAQVAFASAPFLGAGLSFLWLGEPLGWEHVTSGIMLASGVALLMLDQHEHQHEHSAMEHVHSHRHDDGHHDHVHRELAPNVRHTHRHRHASMVHSHRHLPDLHHRHVHEQ